MNELVKILTHYFPIHDVGGKRRKETVELQRRILEQFYPIEISAMMEMSYNLCYSTQ